MDLSTIGAVVNHLDCTKTYWYGGTIHTGYRGLVCTSEVCYETLSKTTGLTKLYSYQWSLSVQSTTIEVDLRNNKNLTSITCSGWYFKVYLPKSITSVNADQSWPPIIRSWDWNYFILLSV